MKTLFIISVSALICQAAAAQTIKVGQFTIDKNVCTITTPDGKTFPLYGRVEIVDHSPDLRVEIVDHSPDIRAMEHHSANHCGEYTIVDHSPDIRIELVDHSPDLRIELVDHSPSIEH